jgi:hypothetical protein
VCGLGLGCLTPLLTISIFQLYRGGLFVVVETGAPCENHQLVTSPLQLYPFLSPDASSKGGYSNWYRPSQIGFRITCERKVGLKLGVVCMCTL